MARCGAAAASRHRQGPHAPPRRRHDASPWKRRRQRGRGRGWRRGRRGGNDGPGPGPADGREAGQAGGAGGVAHDEAGLQGGHLYIQYVCVRVEFVFFVDLFGVVLLHGSGFGS